MLKRFNGQAITLMKQIGILLRYLFNKRRDILKRINTEIVVIDAIKFHNPLSQYSPEAIMRELNKVTLELTGQAELKRHMLAFITLYPNQRKILKL